MTVFGMVIVSILSLAILAIAGSIIVDLVRGY